jgi:hypothetical protein
MMKRPFPLLLSITVMLFFIMTGIAQSGWWSGQQAPQALGVGDSPTFVGETLSGLTASRGVVTDGSKAFASDAAATGTGAPVRQTAPTITSPTIDKINLVPFANLNNFYYGVSWNESTDSYARTGYLTGVATASTPSVGLLPIQEAMRRVILSDAGVVQYYLCDTDSTKKEDCVTAANLDGTDGQVVVEIPKFYYRHRYIGTTHYWGISPVPLAGFTVHHAFIKNGVEVANRYIGAYEGVLYDVSASRYTNGLYQTAFSCTFLDTDKSITANSRTAPFKNLEIGDKIVVSGTASNNGTFTVASIVSNAKITVAEALTASTAAATVIQIQTDVTATTGDKLSSVSGKAPITGTVANGTRAHFRTYAANRGTGWRQRDYDLASAIQLLYLVEYASFYSQSMIGAGISNVTDWLAYNDNNPIAKTGNSNSIGNATGNTAGSTSSATEASKYLSYRGIENWFGHVWKWADGINTNNNRSYVSNNDAHWADDTATNYTDIGVNNANANGYAATLLNIGRGFLPATVGATASTKLTDYYYQASGWRVARLGGSAVDGSGGGGFRLILDDSSANLYRNIGGRLCY